MSTIKIKITCPKCGSTNVARERGINGNDHCKTCLAIYPSQKAVLVVSKVDYDKLTKNYQKILLANTEWIRKHSSLEEDYKELSSLYTDADTNLKKAEFVINQQKNLIKNLKYTILKNQKYLKQIHHILARLYKYFSE